MECLTIGSAEDMTYIKENILRTLPSESIKSISLEYKDTSQDEVRFITIRFTPFLYERKTAALEKMLAAWIRKTYEARIIRHMITTDYGYFTKQEQAKIFRYSLDACSGNEEYTDAICQELSDYLSTSNKLFLDGFVQFRLRAYREKLEQSIEEGVEEFLVEKEYEEFIDLLKVFVELQTPQVEFLHIVSRVDGKYDFYDENEKNITQSCVANFIPELLNGDLNYADMLLSTVIMLAPKKILWHKSDLEKNQELVNTVEKIFLHNVSICRGCPFCTARPSE